MALVSGNEDIVVIVGTFCKICAEQKLGMLQYWVIDDDEVAKLKNHKVRFVRVSDNCTTQSK